MMLTKIVRFYQVLGEFVLIDMVNHIVVQ